MRQRILIFEILSKYIEVMMKLMHIFMAFYRPYSAFSIKHVESQIVRIELKCLFLSFGSETPISFKGDKFTIKFA